MKIVWDLDRHLLAVRTHSYYYNVVKFDDVSNLESLVVETGDYELEERQQKFLGKLAGYKHFFIEAQGSSDCFSLFYLPLN